MFVWCLYVDVSLVSVGLAAVAPLSRVDSAGKSACEECGRRLSRCKGGKHVHGGGHICQDCYDKLRGKRKATSSSCSPSSRPSSDGVAPPPKKRQTQVITRIQTQQQQQKQQDHHLHTCKEEYCAVPFLLAQQQIHHTNWMCLPCCCNCRLIRSVS